MLDAMKRAVQDGASRLAAPPATPGSSGTPGLHGLTLRRPSPAAASPLLFSPARASGPSQPGSPAGPGGPEEDVDVEERQKTLVPKRYRVIFHNDDYTTMEYVIEVLRKFFHKSETEALHIMLTVHKKGKAVAGVYPRDVAETKVAEVMHDARDRGHPLLLTAEPE
jgi:ATP-dependent Clp protease adaptor protein ClpS